MQRSERRRFCALLASVGCVAIAGVGPVAARNLSDPNERQALTAVRAQGGVLLGAARAGDRCVLVGERGIVLWSDDHGRSWEQASVPVSSTLTAVTFPQTSQGWAVGHGGVVLHSADGGRSWRLQINGLGLARIEVAAAASAADAARNKRADDLLRDGSDKPLLDVHFDADARRGLVVGAYGLAFATDDGGATWRSVMDKLGNAESLHLNAVRVTERHTYIAGERGLLLRSSDGGQRYRRLSSPYAGSWFALSGVGDDVLVVAGLRGNACWSTDHGDTFQASQVPMPVSFSSVSTAAGGEMCFVNQAGMLLVSTDRGRSMRHVPLPAGPPLTALLEAADGSLVASSVAGPRRLPAGLLNRR